MTYVTYVNNPPIGGFFFCILSAKRSIIITEDTKS